jgi:MscS family membrane protein
MTTLNYPQRFGRIIALSLILLTCQTLRSQAIPVKSPPSEAPPANPTDTIGRDSPRGTVLGLLSAARDRNTGRAALYLDTPLRGAEAEVLASQLAEVINRRLPPRLNEVSDQPEGSQRDPLNPNEDLIGVIPTAKGNLDILVERVDRGKSGKVWLFSRKTLAAIPDAYRELSPDLLERVLPNFMIMTRVAEIPLFEWLAVLLGMPLLYFLTGVLNRVLSSAAGTLRRRLGKNVDLPNPQILRPPLRLLILSLTIRWLISKVHLPLLARQFWSTTALVIVIVASVWLLMLFNRRIERQMVGRRRNISGAASVSRLVRWLIDLIILFAGLLFTLNHFGINLTATLAGLGVGGIAVALAAQKTLENVIAGVSMIADRAVGVGDVLNIGDIQGTVVEVGLRSTRIRTLDRTIVSLPNGQIANMRLETLSVRDKFLFHPVIGLRYQTTPAQLHSFMAGVRGLLNEHAHVDPTSMRVRFVRFGAYSLDVDILAYVFARDGDNFLEIQEKLLFGIIDIVQKAGAEIAFPSQSLYLTADNSDKLTKAIRDQGERKKADALN